MNWLLLEPLFAAAVSIRNKIIFVFHKLPAHKPCRSRCQSSESTEFLCRRVDIPYMYFVCRIFFFSRDDFVLPLDRFLQS